jgi:hypothetical protein
MEKQSQDRAQSLHQGTKADNVTTAGEHRRTKPAQRRKVPSASGNRQTTNLPGSPTLNKTTRHGAGQGEMTVHQCTTSERTGPRHIPNKRSAHQDNQRGMQGDRRCIIVIPLTAITPRPTRRSTARPITSKRHTDASRRTPLTAVEMISQPAGWSPNDSASLRMPLVEKLPNRPQDRPTTSYQPQGLHEEAHQYRPLDMINTWTTSTTRALHDASPGPRHTRGRRTPRRDTRAFSSSRSRGGRREGKHRNPAEKVFGEFSGEFRKLGNANDWR